MAQIIGLPKLSPTMEEGVLVKWVKGEGDSVEPGDLVAEVETDKANMDFNLEDEGVLLKLLVKEGDTVKLGAPVAILGEEGEDISDLVKEAEAALVAGGAPPSPEEMADKQTIEKQPAEAQRAEPQAAETPAAQPETPAAATPAAATPAAQAATPAAGGRLLASPLAKSLAIELGIDLRSVSGTGPGGRIVERDVRAAASGQGAQTAAQPGQAPAQVSAQPAQVSAQPAQVSAQPAQALAVVEREPAPMPALPGATGDDYRDEPLSNMRKRIAQRMTEAKRDVPHFYLTRSFDAAPLLAFRQRLNALLGDRGKVSVNDLIIKAVALALRREPRCNAAFMGDSVRYFNRVHIGVAVAIEQGLVTPVVRDADLKGIGRIAAEVRDLAQRARDRRLKMEEIQGSTFTVSNLGMFGIEEFQAIINPPEAALLSVGTAKDTPVVKDGEIVIGKRMNVSLSCDHRVIDGAMGARYLVELVELLEQPESLAL